MSETRTTGRVLHWAAPYDLLAWLLLRGKENQFRGRLLQLARIEPGEAVLDVGCGTGSLAIAAKQRVGPRGAVEGIDPSPQMIARAEKKAKKAGVEVTFTTGVAEALPFPDGQFGVAVSTLMMHHLPEELRPRCAREMRRVVKRGGRALVVDFGGGSLFHHHGVDVRQIATLLTEAGFDIAETGALGMRNLNFVLATA